MSNQILSMNKLHLVLRLLIDGKSRRHISRTAEISRNSVDKYVQVFNSHPLSLSELHKLDDHDLQLIVKPEYRSKTSLETLYSEFSTSVQELKKQALLNSFYGCNTRQNMLREWDIHNIVSILRSILKIKTLAMFLTTRQEIN